MTTQLAIHNLLREQVVNRGLALVYVTHNLGVARQLTDRTYVMYAGDVVEAGPTDRLLEGASASIHAGSFALSAQANEDEVRGNRWCNTGL